MTSGAPPEVVRVLHVEDNEWDARVVRDALVAPGARMFRVARARTLAEALAAIEREPPDVVLLDLSLPDSAGLATVTRAVAAAPGTPLVVLAGTDDALVGEAAIHAGAQDYLAKSAVSDRALRCAIRYAIERARFERRAHELDAKLRALERETRQREARLGLVTVVMGVAHEINNPLTFVNLSLVLARKELEALRDARAADAPAIDKVLARLARAGEGANRIGAIVTELDRLRAEGSRRMTDAVELGAIARRAASRLPAPQSQRVTVDGESDAPVHGFADDLEWVASALIGNALEALPPDRGEVRVRVSRERSVATMEVTDTGAGIPAESAPNVFVPFFTTKPDRVGLSLARAHRIATAHGGKLEFGSLADGGTTFRLILPVD